MSVKKDDSRLVSIRSAPEPGQLVEVRRRQWIVSDVNASQPEKLSSVSQHYVSLSSIDEDGLGEILEVIWEIEPGAHIIEKAGMPYATGYDDTIKLEAFLDAVRWGSATNADKGFLQAPYRSGVSIEDFQLDPLVRAIEMARANLLIADDVGLGKTIEAGLVIQELLLRHRARSVFIICPASLQEKWRLEMLEKFGLEFKIVNTDYIRQLRRDRGIHANPWTSFPRLITSMDWIKGGEALRLLREVIPVRASYPRKFDIMVIDEAHNVAPSSSGNYALESQRTKLVKMLSPHFQHKLFLTATPHNGYTESFTSLLELLDDQRFSKNILPDEKQLSKVMVRRLKTDLVDKDGKLLYPSRKLQALSIPYTKSERSIHKVLNQYCKSREKTCQGKNVGGTKFVNSLLKKRLFSSPAAFSSTLEKHFQTITSNKPKEKVNPLADRILRKAILKAEEDYADDAQFEDAQQEAVEEVTKRAPPLTDQEKGLLNELRQWAQQERNRLDSKAEAIIAWIESNLKTNGKWNDQRVILFTEYRSTHQWLFEILASHGYAGERLEVLHGGIDQEEREKIKAAFQTNPRDAEVRILLATDAASEGIDLQNYCNCLIHLEIPYNPNVMEQRNGRIDRHGQKADEVLIWHPVDGGESTDESVGGHKDDIIRALRKLESMREDMGSVNPVIAPQMSSLIEGTIKEFDTQEAQARIAKASRFVRAERQLKERVEKLRARLDETQKDFHLTPERIKQTVIVGLEIAEQSPLISTELIDTPSGSVFIMPALSGSWARCTEGLRHPHTDKLRPITFDHGVAKGRDDVVLIHLNHRLVQMCLRLMRAEVWAQDDVKKLHRVDVRTLADNQLDSMAVIVISRLVITGGNHHRLHEELTAAGGYLKDKGFKREPKISLIENWLDQAVEAKPLQSQFDEISSTFEDNEDFVRKAVDARSKERLKNLSNTLDNRKNQEIKDITTVLDELKKSIENELSKEDQLTETLDMFSDEERTEVKRDFSALKNRLTRIPEEKEQEIVAIQHRYADFKDRTFPVAVIFLFPESKLRGRQ
jgi:SNF2 family DNA or RNA helicase